MPEPTLFERMMRQQQPVQILERWYPAIEVNGPYGVILHFYTSKLRES